MICVPAPQPELRDRKIAAPVARAADRLERSVLDQLHLAVDAVDEKRALPKAAGSRAAE